MLGFKRSIAFGIGLALTVLGLAAGYAYTRWDLDSRASYWIDHAHRVIETSLQVFPASQAVVLAERHVAEHPGPATIASYRRAVAAVRESVQHLAEITRDNPEQAPRVQALDAALERWIEWTGGVVDLAQGGHAAQAQALINGGSQRLPLTAARDATTAGADAERRLLAVRTAHAARVERLSLGIAIALTVLVLSGLVGLIVALSRANLRLMLAAEAARRSQAALETSEALTHALFVNSPDYLIVLEVEDGDRFVVGDLNPALAKVFGVEAQVVRGRAIDELFPPPMAQRLIDHYRGVKAAQQPVWSRTEVGIFSGGPRIWEAILAPVSNPTGEVDRIVGSIRDVTDRVRAEERLAQSQRLEAIGQLTGGVAHDFNNLLQVIRGNLELLAPAVDGDGSARRRLDNAIQGADRAAQLTSHLLAFARRQPLAPRVVDLSRQVQTTADLLKRTLGETIEVVTTVAADLWPTLVDPTQVESAILNLSLNARDAMPGGGRLMIRAENATVSQTLATELDTSPGDFVSISVHDTGEGIAPEVLERVFEPFFTTKSDGKGTGLGLSMVYGFVRQSQGAVQIFSAPGEGTTVTLFLPRSVSMPAAEPPSVPAVATGDQQTILVVEDDPDVRAAAVAMLEGLGYRCREAQDARSALDAFGDGAGIDLIFSDVVMPGPIKATALAEALRRRSPETPLLFTSGYAQDAIVHDGRLDAGVNLLSKPYSREALARKVAQLLAPSTAAS